METTPKHMVHAVAVLLLATAVTQAAYTALYITQADVPRLWLWGIEGLLFVLLAACAGAALVQAKRFHLAWSAMAFAAVLNVVQVGVGLTLFAPFRAASQADAALAPLAAAIVAFSFFVYNAAKILIGLAALNIGATQLNAETGRIKLLGGAAVVVGLVCIVANWAVMLLGRGSFVPSPVAGASGVMATALLALCLWAAYRDKR